MPITFQALSLVEKAEEPIHVCFTLRLRDQMSKWMPYGCKVYVASYMASNGSCFMITWISLKKYLLDLGLTPKTRRPWHYECSQPLIYYSYHVQGHAWIEIHWNSIWLRARSHVTSQYTWGSVTTLHDFGGVFRTTFGHFLFGSHNFMVTALGSCVKWPLIFGIALCMLNTLYDTLYACGTHEV